MRELSLEPRCVRMLVPLDSAQPCTQEQLASRMGVTSPTIMPSVDELHDSGLITRDRNPGDRREHVLRLTGDGRAYLSRALTAEDDAQERLAARLGPAETGRLNALLTLIITAWPSEHADPGSAARHPPKRSTEADGAMSEPKADYVG